MQPVTPTLSATLHRTRAHLLRARLELVLVALFLVAAAVIACWDGPLSRYALSLRPRVRDSLELLKLFGIAHPMLLLVFAIGASGRRKLACQLVVALILVMLTVSPTKALVGRIRPNGQVFSFPSGDAAVAAVLIAPLLLRSKLSLLATLPLALAVASRRVIFGYHWPSDVLAGVAFSIVAGVLARSLTPRWFTRLPRKGWLIALGVVVAGGLLNWFGRDEQFVDFLQVFGPALGLIILAGWAVPLLRWLKLKRFALTHERTAALLVLAIVAAGALLISLAASSSLFDRDEAYYAQVATEMLDSGDLLVPTYQGKPFLHKPPGMYWLMAASTAAVGRSELAFRLPAICATLASMAVVFSLARRLAGTSAGLWSAVAFAACPAMMIFGGAGILDSVVLLTILLAVRLLADDFLGRPHWARTLAIGGLVGISALVKGPVGPAVVLLTAIIGWPLARGFRRLPGYLPHLLVMLAAGAGIFLLWAVPANRATEADLFTTLVGEHVIDRSLAPREGHGGGLLSLAYYLPVIVVGFSPWTVLLAGAGATARDARSTRARSSRALLLAWALPTFVLVSLVQTRLPHYVLPVIPALAIAAGVVVARSESLSARAARWTRRGNALLAVLTLIPGGLLMLTPFATAALANYRICPYLPEADFAAVGAGAVMVVLWLSVRRTDPAIHARSRAAGFALGIAALAVVGASALPRIERWKPARPIAELANRAADETGGEIATMGFRAPSLIHYLRPSPVPDVAPHQLAAWARRPGGGVLIATGKELREARSLADRPIDLTPLARRRGLDYAKGRWIELIILKRSP